MRLAEQRCGNHPPREAVCLCPVCSGYFCRECITEHDGRLLCSACVRRLTAAKGSRKVPSATAKSVAMALGALVVAWLFFYSVAAALTIVSGVAH